MQPETRQGARHTKIRDQCQRAIADGRLADADEHVPGAQIKAALEDGFDLRMRAVSTEFPRHNAGSQDRHDDIRAVIGPLARSHIPTDAALPLSVLRIMGSISRSRRAPSWPRPRWTPRR